MAMMEEAAIPFRRFLSHNRSDLQIPAVHCMQNAYLSRLELANVNILYLKRPDVYCLHAGE